MVAGKRGTAPRSATGSHATLSPATLRALDLVFTPARRLVASVADLTAGGEPVDYILERQIEEISIALERDLPAVKAHLKRKRKSMDSLGDILRRTWLEGAVPECGFELKVRAAEALGMWSVAAGEPRAAIVRRLSARRFEHRMWAARAVRASGWNDSRALLAPLMHDAFADDNGFHLVREAAGFTD